MQEFKYSALRHFKQDIDDGNDAIPVPCKSRTRRFSMHPKNNSGIDLRSRFLCNNNVESSLQSGISGKVHNLSSIKEVRFACCHSSSLGALSQPLTGFHQNLKITASGRNVEGHIS
jgi:hypothetical protein